MNQVIGYNSIIRNNSATITYAYNSIDTTGVITKANIQESFILLPSDEALISANNIILTAISLRLNPIVPILTGTITIKYLDQDNIALESELPLTNLPLGNYYYNAKSFSGYSLVGNAIQNVLLSADNLDQVITFSYMNMV
ncbi:MAG TPA: MucBP domain-containing protein [Clostridium sp.]